MDWQREMCGEVCRMDDRIAVVDDQGGWDVFDLGMNRLDGGEESDIETAKTRCEAWSKTSMSKQSSLASPSGNIYVNVDDMSGPYKRAIRDAVNISPILDVYSMVYGPSWAYATTYRTYDYADPAVSNAYDKPTAWGWCIFDNWGPASKPIIISVSGPEFKTFASAASELERAMDESPIGEHTSQNFANSPRVPEEVDSKDDEPCPLCGSDHFDGKHCQTCGYDVAPDGLNDIDIDDLDEVEDVDDGNVDNDDIDGDEATGESPVEDEQAKTAYIDDVLYGMHVEETNGVWRYVIDVYDDTDTENDGHRQVSRDGFASWQAAQNAGEEMINKLRYGW